MSQVSWTGFGVPEDVSLLIQVISSGPVTSSGISNVAHPKRLKD